MCDPATIGAAVTILAGLARTAEEIHGAVEQEEKDEEKDKRDEEKKDRKKKIMQEEALRKDVLYRERTGRMRHSENIRRLGQSSQQSQRGQGGGTLLSGRSPIGGSRGSIGGGGAVSSVGGTGGGGGGSSSMLG